MIISTANYTLKQATGTLLCLQSMRSLSGQSWLQLWMQQWSRSSGQLHIWQKDSASWIIKFVSTSYIRYRDFPFTGILEEGLSSSLSQKPWCGLYSYITEITVPMCYYWGCFKKHTHWALQDKSQQPTHTARTAIISNHWASSQQLIDLIMKNADVKSFKICNTWRSFLVYSSSQAVPRTVVWERLMATFNLDDPL